MSPDTSTSGGLLIWNPNTNAAHIRPDGRACILAADVYRVAAAAAMADLAADGMGKDVSNVSASGKTSTVQSAMLLSNQDAKGTFLSVALFNLCMLHGNGALASEERVVELFKEALQRAGTLSGVVFNENGAVTALVNLPSTQTSKPSADSAETKPTGEKPASLTSGGEKPAGDKPTGAGPTGDKPTSGMASR